MKAMWRYCGDIMEVDINTTHNELVVSDVHHSV